MKKRNIRQNPLERMERFLVGLIERPDAGEYAGRGVRTLLWILRQMSRAYGAVMGMRLFLYGKGAFRHHTLGCQVISVGNLTVGGTGKTPVVEIFAGELQKAGRRVAVLSRGYKKKKPPLMKRLADALTFREMRRSPRVVSDGRTMLLDSEMSGDEPYMLASNLPEVAVLVDKNRVKSGRYAINKLGCDTLVLDDGFQYMALKHRLEIVLVDKTNPFGNEHVLPRGLLREPVKNISRADFIFITKSDGKNSEELKKRLRSLNSHAEIIECRHCPRYLEDVFSAEQKSLGYLKGLDVMVLSGIAAPDGFEKEVESRGARIVDKRRFADHHRYTQQELIDIINRSRNVKAAAIITTEKDAVRFPKLERCDVPVYFLRVDIEILSGAEDFEDCISHICFR
ncbi:MAG: tetraacyldisaccharide 4'-kinase [Kiritimatiellia bacterium]